MRRIADRVRALGRSERGYTLIELLVATAISMIVLGGAVTVFIGAVRSEPRTASKVGAIQEGRVAAERITRELRQGSSVSGQSASGLSFLTFVPEFSCGSSPATDSKEICRVTYACESAQCTRTVAEPDGGSPGSPVLVVSELSSDEVFSYEPEEAEAEPRHVGVSFSFETREGGPVVVADGATLRNGGA